MIKSMETNLGTYMVERCLRESVIIVRPENLKPKTNWF